MPAEQRNARVATEGAEGTLARLARFFWAQRALSTLALAAVAGFAVSVYLTSVHYASVPLFCSTTGVVNCAAVTSSAYSVVPFTHIPITIPGMLFFAVSGAFAVIALRRAWTGQAEPPRLRLAHVALGAAGLLFVLYLVFAEIVLLRKICEWCTAVHLLTLLTLLVAVWRLQTGDAAANGPAAARPRSPHAHTPPCGSVNQTRNAPARRAAAGPRGHRR